VITCATMARTREIGVRIALGATRSSILNLVLRQSAILTVLGLTAGLLLTVGSLQSAPRHRAHGSVDPGSATLAIATVRTVAASLPARRATRIDPTSALR
jgi:ABC-type antimicrobial peptide transport system permease subunit